MTRDDIIRMAREVGFSEWETPDSPEFIVVIERFAGLVAAHEREECAKVCDAQIERWTDDRARYCASECAAAIRQHLEGKQ